MTFYGYPGVRGALLPDEGTVSRMSEMEDRPYLCVSYDTEEQTVQPLRLAAAIVGGPLVMYASQQLPQDRPVLRAATFATGLGVCLWSIWIWSTAREAMRIAPTAHR